MNNKRILCFLESDRGRDTELLLPLVFYAETYLNCIVEFAFIYDVHAIYRKNPDVVLLPNTIGSNLHFQIAKYAARNNIKVFALTSEGNFRTDGSFDYWGYNKDKNFFQEYICHWSQRTFDFLSEKEPGYKHKMVVTGGTGFDRYKIYKFQTKQDFLSEFNLFQYKKIIGYAGWAFGKLFNQQGREELIQNGHPEERFGWMKQQMYEVEAILKKAIENNPDILFVLKRHPNEANPSITKHDLNEMVRLKDYENVIYLTDNENIHDLISISDIWTGFETTTCLEAWLMGNSNTVLLNPDPDFSRDEVHKGSLIINNYPSFQKHIDEYYSVGYIAGCITSDIQKRREQFIHKTIGFSDGLNHVRAGYYLKKTIKAINNDKKVKVKLHFNHLKKYILMHFGKFFYNRRLFLSFPKFKKTVWIFDNFRLSGLYSLRNKYFRYLKDFYKSNDLDGKIRNATIWKEIIK